MKNNPYVGPRPYEREDWRNFYGRDREARDLQALILAHRVVLLYSQSGAGKTSLLNAKVIPALEDEDFEVLPVVRVGSDLPPNINPDQVDNVFVFCTLMALMGEDTPLETLSGHSLASFLEGYSQPEEETEAFVSGKPLLLIFDQFEEIFTTHRQRWQDAEGFFQQVTQALDALPDLGVIFAMREDHVAELDPYAALLPNRLRARFRIERLGLEGALDALKKPAQNAGCPFAEGVAERLADDLRRIKVQREGRPGETEFLGPHIEPVQLQVVCNQLWARMPEKGLILWGDVRRYGNVDRALIGFYEGILAQTTQETGVSERGLRRWFAEQLITPMGTRGLALRSGEETAGLPNTAVDFLEDQHLIRAEMRAGARWYEIAHDRLVDPILQSNQAWDAARQTPLRMAAQQWKEGGEDPGILYQGKTLAEAVVWAKINPSEVEPYEQEFLEASQQAEQARLRNRSLSIAGAVLAVLIIVVISYLAIKAELARQMAERQKRIATSRYLAARSLTYLDDRLDLALLLSLEANRLTDLTEVKGSLLEALETRPELAAFMSGHKDVRDVTLSPDGQILASCDGDGVILLWDMAARKPLGPPLIAHAGRVASLDFSPDGLLLASASDDNTIILWDVAARQPLGSPLVGHTSIIRRVAFSPDGRLLASGGADEIIIIWDVAARQPLGQLITGYDVRGLAFSPDGKTLVSGGCGELNQFEWCIQGNLIFWDVASRQPLGPPLTDHTDRVEDVTFGPNGRILASSSADKTVILWDVATRKPLGPPLTGHTDYVRRVTFSLDGKRLASGGSDSTIILWDVATRQPIGGPLSGHAGVIWSMTFSLDGRNLISGGSDDNIILWDVTGDLLPLGEKLSGHTHVAKSLAFSPDGQTLASASCNKLEEDECQQSEIRLWDMTSRQPIGEPLIAHTSAVAQVIFSPDGKLLASASEDKTVILWDVASRQPIGPPLTGHTERLESVAFSPDGKILASAGWDHTIILWDVATRQPLGSALTGSVAAVRGLAFSPDGQILASAGCSKLVEELYCRQGEIRLWDVATRQLVGSPLIEHVDWILDVVFSSDGKLLASAGADSAIILWDTASRQPILPSLAAHADWVNSVAFSPDGSLLASGSDDKTVILWDLTSRQQLGPPLPGHTDWVKSVAFSPRSGGRTLASAGSEAINLWDISFESWKARACRRANRNLTRAEWDQFIGSDAPYQRSCPDLPSGDTAD